MTIQFKRKALIASTLAFGLFATLQLPQALAKDKSDDRYDNPRASHERYPTPRPQPRMRDDMMNHGQRGQDRMSDSGTYHNNMNHDRTMQQMHQNRGQMDHGNMGDGRMNHGSTPPAKGKGKGPKNDDRY